MMTRNIVSALSLSVMLCFIVPLELKGQSVAELRAKLEKLHAYPDVLVFNGKIATMDEKLSTFDAMAVRDHRILTLGSNSEIRPLAGPNTQMIDAKGRTVLPGLIDSHTHPHLWLVLHYGSNGVAAQYDPQFEITYVKGDTAVEIADGVEKAIGERAKELGPGKWIWIRIYPNKDTLPEAIAAGREVFQQRLISRTYLDTLAPQNPVIVMNAGLGIPSVHNSRAKEIMEQVLGREVEGLRALYYLPMDIILRGKTEAIAALIKREAEECLWPYGITTVANHIEPLQVLKALNMMDRRGEMPVRWAWVHRTAFTSGQADPAEFYKLIGDFRGMGSDYLWHMGVGSEGNPWDFCFTGTPRDAKLREERERMDPCANLKPGNPNYDAHLEALKAGQRITYIHAFDDGDMDGIIGWMEQAERAGVPLEQIRANRSGFDHVETLRPDQIPKLVKYGLWVNLQGFQVIDKIPALARDYGERYLKWVQPTKDLVDAGVPVLVTTDAHITKTAPEARALDWPWDNSIWPYIAFFVTREEKGQTWMPEQRIDRITALRGITTLGAEYVLREKDLGSLEVGKLADFIVIDKDYFTIPESQIKNIKTLATAIGGRLVYRSPEF